MLDAGPELGCRVGRLIQTLVQLGKTLQLERLAEGIEEQVQLKTSASRRYPTKQNALTSFALSRCARPADRGGTDSPIAPDSFGWGSLC